MSKNRIADFCVVVAILCLLVGLLFGVEGYNFLSKIAIVGAGVAFFTAYFLRSLYPHFHNQSSACKKDNCTSSLDDLNRQVTTAVYELENAQRKLSHLEEMIANLTAPSSVEGQVARRSAVRSAVDGRDEERAKELVKRFLAEEGIDAKLSSELKAFLNQA